MEIEGVEFKEALEILGRKAGVEIKKEPIQKRTERQRVLDICELATKFFEKQLQETKIGKKATEYLLSRKISQNSIGKWRLGYAPNTWRGLSDFLVSKGYKRKEIIKAGLAVAPEENQKITPYDRFRGRIMFPIFNLQGQVVGFGGRTTKDIGLISGRQTSDQHVESKYVNTPNTPVYDKSRILYGLHGAKTEMRKRDDCILVEGYTDVILSSQEGIMNIVATSGTALTPYQLKILSRYTKNLILGFDMDIAGEAATRKGIDTAQSQGFNIKIISLPEGKDPADVISKKSSKWQGLIESAKNIIDFYLQQTFQRFDKKTLEGKKDISKLLLPFISRIQNKIEQDHRVKELAKELDVKEETIWKEVEKTIINEELKEQVREILPELPQREQKVLEVRFGLGELKIPHTLEEISREFNLTREKILQIQQRAIEKIKGYKKVRETKEEVKFKTQRRLIEERLLMLFLKFPDNIKKIKKIPGFSFSEGRRSYSYLKEGKGPPKELKEFFSLLELQFEVEKEKGEIDPEEEIQFCISSLQTLSRGEEIKRMTEEVKKAEMAGDKKKISKLLKKLSQI